MAVREQVTRALVEAQHGGDAAASRLWALVYDEMRQLAHHQLRHERRAHTLSTTGLVHEAYLRLVDDDGLDWQDRAHFYGIASRVMRRILVDYARRRAAQKRGGDLQRTALREELVVPDEDVFELVALDDALARLALLDERRAQIVEMRYFGGLSQREIADVLGVHERTVEREWAKARGWLFRAMGAAS